jgi:hypothetical protein
MLAVPIALSSFAATAGLLFTFVIVLPIIAQGLIAVAVAQAMGERAENRRFVEEHAADHRRD